MENKSILNYSSSEYKVNSLLIRAKNTDDSLGAYNIANQAGELAFKLGLKKGYADSCLIQVEILKSNGAYNEAMLKNMEALSFFKGSEYQEEEANCWQNLGVIYKYLGEHEKQLEYNIKCYEIIRNLEKKELELRVINNIGDNYLSLFNYDKALEIFQNNLNNPDSCDNIKCVSLKNIGATYYRQKEYDKSVEAFHQAEILADKIGNEPIKSAANFYLGKIYFDNKDFKKSLNFMEQSFEIVKAESNLKKEKLQILEPLIANYLELNSASKALEYYKVYNDLNQEYKNRISDQTIKNTQFKFEVEDIEKEKEILRSQNELLLLAKEKIEKQKQKLEEKSRQLQSANQELRSFAHVVSHDIKEPIRTLKNFSTFLKKELGEDISERSKEYLDYIMTSSTRLSNFVSDILNYTTTGKTERRASKDKVNCNNVIELVNHNLKLKLAETNGKIIASDLPIVFAHTSLMIQVFQNLISNSLKFSKKDIPPVIKISAMEVGQYYQFRLEDNGIGIKEEHLKNVFHLFTRLNSPADFEGSGIGLSTVQKILKMYGGNIKVESIFGEGTTFIIKLPRFSV